MLLLSSLVVAGMLTVGTPPQAVRPAEEQVLRAPATKIRLGMKNEEVEDVLRERARVCLRIAPCGFAVASLPPGAKPRVILIRLYVMSRVEVWYDEDGKATKARSW